MGMKKYYIVELREEEADELMNDHWVGELVRCEDCKHNISTPHNPMCELDINRSGGIDWFCADGERRTE